MNLERFKIIVNRIKDNPSCWNQKVWHCGSAHCIAGHAQIDSGKAADGATARRDAIEWLDLSEQEANCLFAAHRTIKDFETVIARGSIYDADGYDLDDCDCEGYNKRGYDPFGYSFGDNCKPRFLAQLW
jgi:hypothetical protein